MHLEATVHTVTKSEYAAKFLSAQERHKVEAVALPAVI
jgi:hypothetical protein